jgi:ribosomal protein S18 acetylase RimI-like enzyme
LREESYVVKLRPLFLPEDWAPLLALDTSFTTDRVFRVERTGRSFTLEEMPVMPPIHKSYPIADEVNTLSTFDWVQVAGEAGEVVGLAAMKIEEWNRRANLRHLYLAPSVRGQGVGRAMVESAIAEARRRDARTLWVETQTINYGAIRFYERVGFAWCGLDTTLYDPSDCRREEVALFFTRAVV